MDATADVDAAGRCVFRDELVAKSREGDREKQCKQRVY